MYLQFVEMLVFFSPVQRGWDSYIVYLFDKSITTYSGPFSARQLPDKVNTIGDFMGESLIKIEMLNC